MADLGKRGLEGVLTSAAESLFSSVALASSFFSSIFNSDCEWPWLLFCDESALYTRDTCVNINIRITCKQVDGEIVNPLMFDNHFAHAFALCVNTLIELGMTGDNHYLWTSQLMRGSRKIQTYPEPFLQLQRPLQ